MLSDYENTGIINSTIRSHIVSYFYKDLYYDAQIHEHQAYKDLYYDAQIHEHQAYKDLYYDAQIHEHHAYKDLYFSYF